MRVDFAQVKRGKMNKADDLQRKIGTSRLVAIP